ncbi:hypothetical protein Tco_0527580 [Tanacetum coccineum]
MCLELVPLENKKIERYTRGFPERIKGNIFFNACNSADVIKNLEKIRKKIFWGGEGKNLSWVKWDSVLTSFGEGGLNIGSLRAKNLDLFGKWWWRFRREGGSLWVRVIKSIHGDIGGLGVGRGLGRGGGGGMRVVCGTRGRGLMAFGVGNEIGLEVLGVGWTLGVDGVFSVRELARLIKEKVLRVESGGKEMI